jgi:peroxidase
LLSEQQQARISGFFCSEEAAAMARGHQFPFGMQQQFDRLSSQASRLSRSASRQMKRRYFELRCEALEARTMLSVAPLYYSVTGAGNNLDLAKANWGAAGQDLLRSILPPAYSDGVSALADKNAAGQTLPSARLISNTVGQQTDDVLNNRDLSAFVYAWGQFIDHDLDLTPDGGTSVPIKVPTGDPQFDLNSAGGQTLPFTRSMTDPTTGTSTSNPLNQVTVITSFLDGSMVYGSDPARAAALRTFQGGRLKTSAGDLLPFNTGGLPNANNSPYPDSSMFLGGDIRANENIELTSLQVLFVREHNRQASILANAHPKWNDAQLYQGARQIVIAEIQSITVNEFLPAILGRGAITPYTGYDPNVNPGIAAEFSEAAYRFAHSQLDDDVQFLNNNGTNFSFTYTLPDGTQVPVNSAADIASGDTGISLVDAFFNPSMLEQRGVEGSILKYLASDVAQAVDTKMVDSVRNILFGAPGSGAGGQDLFALDVQRGRDVGLPTYNAARVAYGLPAVTSFSQITSDPTLQGELQQLYGNVNNVELFAGGLAEDHAPHSSMGPTFQAIIANQFERTRDGDRLWYQNIFSGADLKAIQNTTLADIVRLNTRTTNLQDNVFIFDATITGRVFLDANGDGQLNSGEQQLAGMLVQLIDSSGNIVASTHTTSNGSYKFDDLAVGTYRVRVAPPPGMHSTTGDPVKVQITRGGTVAENFGFAYKAQPKPGTPTSTAAGALGAGPQASLPSGPANQSLAAPDASRPA